MNPLPIVQIRSIAKTYFIGAVRVAALEDGTPAVGEGRFVPVRRV